MKELAKIVLQRIAKIVVFFTATDVMVREVAPRGRWFETIARLAQYDALMHLLRKLSFWVGKVWARTSYQSISQISYGLGIMTAIQHGLISYGLGVMASTQQGLISLGAGVMVGEVVR